MRCMKVVLPEPVDIVSGWRLMVAKTLTGHADAYDRNRLGRHDACLVPVDTRLRE